MSDAAPDLLSVARSTPVVVIGGGLAGLAAAHEFAKVGMPVTLLEAADRFGGLAATVDAGGCRVEVAADSFAVSGGAVARLADDLEIADRIVAPAPGGTWIAGLPGGPAPLPAETILGIPANPWAPEVRRLIGSRGAWRAYLDRLRPPLTIGRQRSLGELVRSRMGARVLERMVAPVSRGVYVTDPAGIDVDLAAPGLNPALTRTGSLGGAVAQILPEGPRRPARASFDGGMPVLIDALCEALIDLGAQLHTEARATGIRPRDRSWVVEGTEADGEAFAHDAVLVVVATPEPAARALLEPHVTLPPSAAPDRVDVVTLVLDRGAGGIPTGAHTLVPVSPTAAVRSVVDVTAAWPDRAVDVDVVRVVLDAADGHRSDAAAVRDATAAIAALTGTEVPAGAVRGSHRVDAQPAWPAAAFARADVAAARAAVRGRGGLYAVGAWLAGSGIAQVVADAAAQADRARSAVLWNRTG